MYAYLLFDTMRSPAPSQGDIRGKVESAVIPLETRLDYLELACAGLWKILKDKHGYTDEELVSSIQAVDAMDGKVDGKIGRAARACPHCDRKLLTRDSPKCSWCGGELGHRPLG